MQLINTVQNEAIISNVAEIGEFRIRNSAKAFNILSSGLYANKIKAIVRELSCNAVDSHTAAGKADTPFDVHLPTQLEPWFAIRDYGTGLNHDQVTNIYTTYFESTKTDSNDYIGALGLGSKSPFAYTDNFTVTAVKDGNKGVYSAFINDQGVPSIALMATEVTDEPAGVEVKFSVNDRWDFDKFYNEARAVYKWFKLRPVISGPDHFTFAEVEYKEQNVIPGVHINDGYRNCTAVMGNIAYPVEIPNPSDLGEVSRLLGCGLVMEFAIGELDFQASREGLSYIPQTVAAIKRKLEAVNAVLADKIAQEANVIDNLWERAAFLVKKADIGLYRAAVIKYADDTELDLVTAEGCNYVRYKTFKITLDELKNKYNIAITAFEKSRGNPVCSRLRPYKDWNADDTFWDITPSLGTHFVVNDTKLGAGERAKYHWRNGGATYVNTSNHDVFVIEPADKNLPVKIDEFFAAINNPPESRILKASNLLRKARTGGTGNGMAKDVTILRLEKKGYGGYHTSQERVWRDAGKADSFDAAKTYYYLPLSGFNVQTKTKLNGGAAYWELVTETGLPDMPNTIYGVRKADIEFIKTQKNWINLDKYLTERVAKLAEGDVASALFKYIDFPRAMRYNEDIVNAVDSKSPYAQVVTEIKETYRNDNGDRNTIAKLLREFNSPLEVTAIMEKYRNKISDINNRYPLIPSISSAAPEAIAEYINLVDQSKGI